MRMPRAWPTTCASWWPSAARGPCTTRHSWSSRDGALRLDLALQWTESTDEHLRSYVNGIPTGSGGTHENGFRAGLGKAMRNFIETHNLTPRGVTLTAEDLREGLVGVLSVFIEEPQFQGQTKDRLNNPEVQSAVDGLVRPALEHWLNQNISIAEAIVARVILAARAREASRAAQQEVTRKTRHGAPADAARQALRLHHHQPRPQRAVHRRGRLGRRLGQAGTRPRPAGDPAAARQGAEHRERVDGQGAREQGTGRPGHGARLRRRQALRHRPPALRQGDPAGRCRLGRPSHLDAAADVHLPAHAAADRRAAASTWRSRRCSASTSARRRSGPRTMRSAMRS